VNIRVSAPNWALQGKEKGTFWFLISVKKKIATSVIVLMCAVDFVEPDWEFSTGKAECPLLWSLLCLI
jgi:hypothetical protein